MQNKSKRIVSPDLVKYFVLIGILIAEACGNSTKSISNNPADPLVLQRNTIQVRMNEEKTIQLPGIASGNQQIAFTLSDTSVASITRKQMLSTYDSTNLRPGDPVLAVWVVKGLKPGTTKMKFARGSFNEKGNGRRLRNYSIVVTE